MADRNSDTSHRHLDVTGKSQQGQINGGDIGIELLPNYVGSQLPEQIHIYLLLYVPRGSG